MQDSPPFTKIFKIPQALIELHTSKDEEKIND